MTDCDEFQDLDETFLLRKGTILYSGNTAKGNITLKDIFEYVGQRGKNVDVDTFVLYATTNFDTALGYARSCLIPNGNVHKFKVSKDSLLLKGDVFEDAELVEKCVCLNYKGYAVIYSDTFDEFALCNSKNYLEYLETFQCKSNSWVSIADIASEGMCASDLYDIM